MALKAFPDVSLPDESRSQLRWMQNMQEHRESHSQNVPLFFILPHPGPTMQRLSIASKGAKTELGLGEVGLLL